MKAIDVADYLLKRTGVIGAGKFQKLMYYAQAWSLVWDERPLFDDRIEAWASGPICPNLYQTHRGLFEVARSTFGGDETQLDDLARETVDAVLKYYGDQSCKWLSQLAYAERPWQESREGAAPGDRGKSEITLASMHEYYDGLT